MRYLPLTPEDRAEMLAVIGAKSIDELFVDVPAAARRTGTVDLPAHLGELEVERELSALAGRNIPAGSAPFFCGAGAYRHHVPASVDHIIQRSEFLTSYTPYQPEIAQGTLRVLYEFQTQVAALTGMDVANASMYDGSTACAEAVLMAARVTRRSKAVLSGGVHPHYVASAETLAHASNLSTHRCAPAVDAEAAVIDQIDADTACVVVQTPNVFGTASDVSKIAEAAHAAGALLIVVVTEAVSFGLLKAPGAMGADIVAAEGQSIGNGLNFGGPYVGLFAAREKLMRQMPGRLCGETVDADGRRGFVLTLSTREQELGFMECGLFYLFGAPCFVSRSGYTGEDGYEISIPATHAVQAWDTLLSNARVKPIGLGARDSLRLEAGLPLYGHDADPSTSPVEAALTFALSKRRREAADFPGAQRILRELSGELTRVRVGLKVLEGAPAREGAEIAHEGRVVGRVTSGGPSPSLGHSIAMGYVPPGLSALGTRLEVLVRGRAQPAEVVAMPFVPNRYYRKS